MYDLAGAYQNKNEYKRAEKLYSETLVLQRKLKDKYNQAYTLANLGLMAQADENDYKKANSYYQDAIRLGTELKDDNIIAYCYLRLKGLNRVQGNFKIAEDYIKKALGLYTKINQPKNIAYTLVEMGNDAADRKDYEEYLQLFKDAGWEHLGEMGGWQYFRTRGEGNAIPEIYTDKDSKAQKYQRLIIILTIFLPIFVTMGTRQIDPTSRFSELYLAGKFLMNILMLIYAYAMIMIFRRIQQLKNK